ncbi:N-(5-amino-5-carboxypentanoyl)-L-cysteinyl-D-valine synthase [Glonium stellatum]|uniref:N-(5-amino-5-carboxypentanoyl)-L-cysteinyl-D-valine synthase n=1 Tax=Glonium stellatum TaxID=574774 RepID=A0A8E2ETY5_9PEZI|nr:N-(5-amino-5-carboxypentanoyl)-L-cysteinyl-D-valine synthase [Glonium stellatum]
MTEVAMDLTDGEGIDPPLITPKGGSKANNSTRAPIFAMDFTARCDLSAMAQDSTKYRLSHDNNTYVPGSLQSSATQIDISVYAGLMAECAAHDVSLASIAIFAIHKAFHAYGGGSHTIIACPSSAVDGQSFAITIVCHQESKGLTCFQGILGLHKQYEGPDARTIQESYSPIEAKLVDCVIQLSGPDGKSTLQRPLSFSIQESDNQLKLEFAYNKDVFHDYFPRDVLDVIRVIMRQLSQGLSLEVSELEFLSNPARLCLDVWNQTEGSFPEEKRLNNLVEEAVARDPDKVATIFRGVKRTYGELESDATRLAHFICNTLCVKPEQIIALFLDKSDLMITSVFAVWKSGAAYTPIDPTFPDERIRFILRDTGVKVIVANDRHVVRLNERVIGVPEIKVISIEPLMHHLASEDSSMSWSADKALSSGHLAYITYTSGTTGIPKGVSKVHRSVVNSISDLSVRYNMNQPGMSEVVLLFAAYVFEPFVRQTLMALTNGHVLAIIDDQEKLDPDKLVGFIQEHGVTYLNGTASVISEFQLSGCPSLRRLILVGENLTEQRYRQLRSRFKGRVFNEYGFTESAFVTALKVFEPLSARTDASIGRPLRNVKCYVLNEHLKRMPIGTIGELHIGGLGVAQGYVNRPELTRSKFLQNPYQTAEELQQGANSLIYKTGDLARLLPNSEIEYLGRSDFQIKLRGLRIEPGEIESTMSLYPGIRSCVVQAREYKTGKHLIAYFVSDRIKFPEALLLGYLESKLPRYMVPTRLIQIPQMPVTVNGKVDLRALPHAELGDAEADGEDMQDDVDAELRNAWSDLLGVNLESISLESNFFRLGGHSIACIQLIGRVRKKLAIEMTMDDVFAAKTLGVLSSILRRRRKANIKSEDSGRPPVATPSTLFQLPATESVRLVDAYFPANSLQQGLFYRYLKRSVAVENPYTLQVTYRYSASLQPEIFHKAWSIAQEVFACLRARFVWAEAVLHIVDKKSQLRWRFIDFSHLKDQDQHAMIDRLLKEDRKEAYEFEISGLFRIYLIKLDTSRFNCIFSCHHAILDGWSLPILFESVHDFYLKLLSAETVARNPDSAYSAHFRYLEDHRRDHLRYWSDQVARIEDRCDLGVLVKTFRRPSVRLEVYDEVTEPREKTVMIEPNWSNRDIFSACGITLHSILQFIWHTVLHKYGGGRQTVVGTIVSGRNLPIEGIEDSVGLFINTLPLIIDHDEQEGSTVLEAIYQIQRLVNALNSKSNIVLSEIQDGRLKHRLFDTLFVLENYPSRDKAIVAKHQKSLNFTVQSYAEKLDHPIAIVAREVEDGKLISVSVSYAGELFADSTIDILLDMVDSLFQQVTAAPAQDISRLKYVSSSHMSQLSGWNSCQTEFPSDLTLNEIFEREVCRVPGKVAVIKESTKVTYSQLNYLANAVASRMTSLFEMHPEAIIGVLMDKSVFMMAAFLAIWKAGGAFVPIDPGFPDDRVAYILCDTSTRLVLTDKRNSSRLRILADRCIVQYLKVDDLDVDLNALPRDSVNFLGGTTSANLAYVMYTSGTTGRPKGVMIEHRGVVNLQNALSKLFNLRATDDEVLFTFSNPVFDHFIEVFTDALLNGQTLLLLPDGLRSDPKGLRRYISEHRVTYLSGTPTVVSMYKYHGLKHLRRVDCIGEAFTKATFAKIRETFDGLIINGYGPTEVSITSHKRLYPPGHWREDQSIGSPIANTTTYVLDQVKVLVPIGGVGEMYIGGVGVGRGYLNLPELTAEKFVPNPFQTEKERKRGVNSRLYRTGDLVRWIPEADGEVEYFGRNDFQVKIRGVRIELGEVETVLDSYPGIKQCVVILNDQSAITQPEEPARRVQYLVGFYLSDNLIREEDISKFILSKLPEYMVPRRFIPVESFPVTASGKLDTKLLPAASLTGTHLYPIPARNEVEAMLCVIWSELLGIPVETIGVQDDFFVLGGDSLLSTKLSFRISKAFGQYFTVASIFKHPTINAMSQLLSRRGSNLEAIPRLRDNSAPVPLSPAQERVIFIGEYESGTDAYNIVENFVLLPSTHLKALQESIHSILTRHTALRTILVRTDAGILLQKVLEPELARQRLILLESTVKDRHELNQLLVSDGRHIFNLEHELPIRVRLCTLHQFDEERYLGIVLHHACFDAWSWTILKADLASFYSFHVGISSHANLAQQDVGFLDSVNWQRQAFSGMWKTSLKEFWAQRLDGFQQSQLPTDFTRPQTFRYEGRNICGDLGFPLGAKIRELATSLRVTAYSILLAAFCILVNTYAHQRDIVVGIPVTTRTRSEFEEIIGCFVNMLVFRADVDNQSSAIGFIRKIRDDLVLAQLHQDMPFQEVVRDQRPPSNPTCHPLIQLVFNFESQAEHQSPSSDDTLPADFALREYRLPSSAYTTSKFDLAATVIQKGDNFRFMFNYPISLFQEATVKGFTTTYERILHQLSELAPADGLRLADLRLTDSFLADKSLQEQQNKARRAPAVFETIHDLFRWVVSTSPQDETAVICGTTRLSYQTLDERSDRLATHLHRIAEIKPDDIVALVLDRSELIVVSILAIWKAGAAYLPVDPSYPPERIAYMLADSGASAVIANMDHARLLESTWKGQLLPIMIDDPVTTEILLAGAVEVQRGVANSKSLAYLIYTSGTTGQPKAVLVEHRNLLSFQNSVKNYYFGSTPTRRQGVLQLSNYVFDFSLEQLALSVLSGHRLIIPPQVISFDDETYLYLNNSGLTYLSGTPSFLQHVEFGKLTNLAFVTSAGEQLHADQYRRMREHYQGPIYNAYGTTETTVYNMIQVFHSCDHFVNSLGSPLPNTEIHILSEAMQPLPDNAIGELYLSGDCVTRGYLNRPEELRKNYFTGRSFGNQHNEPCVLYKTGDLVRREIVSGHVEYIGRRDDQVKIRGFRVEIGEVKVALAAVPGVSQSGVFVETAQGKRHGSDRCPLLVGYFVPMDDSVTIDEVFTALNSMLPAHAVPARLVKLSQVPLTPSGKADFRAIRDVPPPEKKDDIPSTSPPMQDVELQIISIWKELLGIEHVAPDDDFFAVGGDSILSLQVVAQIRRDLGLAASVKDIFECKTVRALVRRICHEGPFLPRNSMRTMLTEQGVLSGLLPMLPIQDWFFGKPLASPSHWNQFFTIQTPTLDLNRLEQTLIQLQEHHDALRLRFRQREHNKMEQFYAAESQLIPLQTWDPVSSNQLLQDSQAFRSINAALDIQKGPTFAAAYIPGPANGVSKIVFICHHLVIDSTSWRVITRDLHTLYDGGDIGRKGTSYRQWAEILHNFKFSVAERRFWNTLIASSWSWADELPPPSQEEARPEELTMTVYETTLLLQSATKMFDARVVELLLAALGHALKAVSGKEIYHITFESHGREPLQKGISLDSTVGWFTTMFPFRIKVMESVSKTVGDIKKYFREVPRNGLAFGVLHGYQSSTLPRVSFNYLGRVARQIKSSQEIWALSGEEGSFGLSTSLSDKDHNHSDLDVTAIVADGMLRFMVSNRLSPKVPLVTALQSSLQDLIGPCQNALTLGDEAAEFVPYFEFPSQKSYAPTLFLLPPGEGGAESYFNNLAKHIVSFHVVIFNNYYLHTRGSTRCPSSFETLASFYLNYVRQVQPSGPYSFLGWSFGGILSFEMARQLRAGGQQVANLFLIDPFFNVRKAIVAIGFTGSRDDILDPIHVRYVPEEYKGAALAERVVLFKAMKMVEDLEDQAKERLFRHYLLSKFNNLDTLMREEQIRIVALAGASHFSWVKNGPLISQVAAVVDDREECEVR